MALLFCDGFDHYATADIAKKWDASASVSIGAYGRNGTNGLRIPADGSSYQMKKTVSSGVATMIAGVAINPPAVANYSLSWGFMKFMDGGAVQVQLYHNGSGAIFALRGSVTLASTANGVLKTGSYNYIECKVTINNTTGSVEVRVNGNTVINISGVDTQDSGTNQITAVILSGAGISGNTDFDDFYVCDTTGTTNNDFLDQIRIATIYPTAEGTNTGWTPLSGTDNALMVDETSQDGDTTYNYTDTISARDTYVMQDINTLGGEVYAVAVNAVFRKEGDTTRKVKTTIKSGTTYALGIEQTLGPSYTATQDIHNLNPDGSVAWTESSVNAIEAGIDLTV